MGEQKKKIKDDFFKKQSGVLIGRNINPDEKDQIIVDKIQKFQTEEKLKTSEIAVFTYSHLHCNTLQNLLGKESKKLQNLPLFTVENYCMSVLLEKMKLENDYYTVIDTEDQKNIVEYIIEENSIKSDRINSEALYYEIMKAKGHRMGPEEYFNKITLTASVKKIISFVFAKYVDFLNRTKCIDHIDVIRLTAEWVNTTKGKKYLPSFKAVVIDEFQEFSAVKFDFLDILIKKIPCVVLLGNTGMNVNDKIIVRDNIYFKRDIDFDPFEYVASNYKKVKTVWINKDPGENLNPHVKETEKLSEGKIKIHHFSSKNEVYEIRDIIMLMRKEIFKNSRLYSDFAIMCRNPHVMDILKELFRRHDIKYKIKDTSILDSASVKIIFYYVQLIINNSHDFAMKKILNFPRRGIGKITRDIIEDTQKRTGCSAFEAARGIIDDPTVTKKFSTVISDFVNLIEKHREAVFAETDIKKFIEELIADIKLKEEYDKVVTTEKNENIRHIEEFVEFIERYQNKYPGRNVADFVSYCCLPNEYEDFEDGDNNEVVVAEPQNCRGLSAPIIFIPGLEEKFFPYYENEIDTTNKGFEDLILSEKKIFGLFLSGVREAVYLSWAKERRTQEKNYKNKRSRFFEDIPVDFLIECNVETKEKPGEETKNKYRKELIPKIEIDQDNTYKKGDHVVHAMWGSGVITGKKGKGKEAALVIDFENAGEKTLLLKFAPLRKEK